MPITTSDPSSGPFAESPPDNTTLFNKGRLGYDYVGPDMRPGSPMHEFVLKELRIRRDEALRARIPKFPTMREMDHTLRAFVHLSDVEQKVKDKDPRKPVPIVVPVMYAAYETLNTNYLSMMVQQDTLDPLEGRGPEDTVGAILAERTLDTQACHFDELYNRYVQGCDFLKYGVGAVTPMWEREMCESVQRTPRTAPDPITGQPTPTGDYDETPIDVLDMEGNRVHNIDQYLFWPDPHIPIHNVDAMEYVTYGSRTNSHNIYNRETLNPDQGWINARYLMEISKANGILTIPSINWLDSTRETGIRVSYPTNSQHELRNTMAHECFAYLWIVPSLWGPTDGGKKIRLGKEEFPVLYKFCWAADRIVLLAQPLGLRHKKIPVCVAAPTSSGYDSSPVAHLEMVRGPQKIVDYWINSYNEFIRKFRKGRWMGDPKGFDVRALLAGADFVPTRRPYGGERLDNILQSVPITNPFLGDLFPGLGYMQDIIQRATGATDNLQGTMQRRSEAPTAAEANSANQGAVSRVEKLLLLATLQSGRRLTWLKLKQMQQFMSDQTFVRIAGRGEQELLAEYGYVMAQQGLAFDPATATYFPVDPRFLDVSVDVQLLDVTRKGTENVQFLVQLWQAMLGDPSLNAIYDAPRLLQHIARLSGCKNVEDFVRKGGQMVAQQMGAQAIQQQAQAGNMIPASEAAANVPAAA